MSPSKLATAKSALVDAINESPDGRVSRSSARYIKGVTLGLLDELVRRGEIVEIQGAEQCRLGRATRAYALAGATSVGISEEEAYEEFQEAKEAFLENPAAVEYREALEIFEQLRRKAEEFNQQYFMPAVPLSRMTKDELKALPKIIEMAGDTVLLRGRGEIPEPEKLLDEDSPLDINGCNLWFRYRTDGRPFADWKMAGRLKLDEFWDESVDAAPMIVPL
jgi:predicted RNase H-like HicB family nuclease